MRNCHHSCAELSADRPKPKHGFLGHFQLILDVRIWSLRTGLNPLALMNYSCNVSSLNHGSLYINSTIAPELPGN